MIGEIKMQNVASYKAASSLITDKRINLVYGLNGTGKSTISDFLYDRSQKRFASCGIAPADIEPVVVYNQTFVRDNFFLLDSLKGIFSLSKENKTAEKKIADAQKRIRSIDSEVSATTTAAERIDADFQRQRQAAIDEVWKIKVDYTGGDRVLEFCLDGLKGQKDKLFTFLVSLAKPSAEPQRNDTAIRLDAASLAGAEAQPLDRIDPLYFSQQSLETCPLLAQSIVGSGDSVVAGLIESLGNSDWVRAGLEYAGSTLPGASSSPCPFCQELTITSTFLAEVQSYFDETYQGAIESLGKLEADYRNGIASLPNIEAIVSHPLAGQSKASLERLHRDCVSLWAQNVGRIASKLKNPRNEVSLVSSSGVFEAINNAISTINSDVDQYNNRLRNKAASLTALKNEFWLLMRWKYDQTITRFQHDEADANKQRASLASTLATQLQSIEAQRKIVISAQAETINVGEAVDNINAGLLELAIEDFEIRKHSDNLYRIVRAGDPDDAFHTLSEGEKMIVSFLYFCELCKGRSSAEDTGIHRIAVIDDPISSLSHIYIFNIGRLIKRLFFQSERFSQVFLLTHSLYFFYEMTETNHDRRRLTQNLFRIAKNKEGSSIRPMSYDEIQNDYQSYWEIVKDSKQSPALIANCMRNIVEHFFSFVRRKDLNNVFQMPALQEGKHQAFCRFMNRESHSLGQNIFDIKEFDYQVFREGLKAVFDATGHSEHFKEMMK